MQITASQDVLMSALSAAHGIVPKRTTKPIILHVLLEAEEGVLTLSSTDDEMSFVGKTKVTVTEEGAMAVNSKDLISAVRTLPSSKDVTLKLEGNQVVISCGRTEFELPTMPASEFPEFPRVVPEESYTYPASSWVTLLERTIFAVAQDEIRAHLGGVLLEKSEGEGFRAVSTDGHRLAFMEGYAPKGLDLKGSHIIPKKLATELKKTLETLGDGDVVFGFRGSRIIFDCGESTLMGSMLSGEFPDYRMVVPKTSSMHCRMDRQDLIDALKRVHLFSPNETGIIKVEVDGDDFTLSSNYTGKGKGKETLTVQAGGGEIVAGYHALFMIEALQSIDTDDVLLEFNTALQPLAIKPCIEGAVSTHINVVMPMRL